ncbi:hypothetical protein MUG91_G234n48 [Manis pentadactyla]|nr:hypothetical protein MUG91_G234n48 [Manis pentadactyla]
MSGSAAMGQWPVPQAPLSWLGLSCPCRPALCPQAGAQTSARGSCCRQTGGAQQAACVSPAEVWAPATPDVWAPVPLTGPGGRVTSPEWGASPHSQLGFALEEGLASSVPLSLDEVSESYESSHLASSASVPEQDTPERWKQMEPWSCSGCGPACSCKTQSRWPGALTRLVAVREALTQIRKERALQDAEQQDAEQEAGLRSR